MRQDKGGKTTSTKTIRAACEVHYNNFILYSIVIVVRRMSLFKVRDCWSTVCGRGETFGCDALAVDDLFGAGEDSIILGSLDGVLRVYGVHSAPPSNLQYSPSDLLIEMQMDSPVLQVCTGKLIRSVMYCLNVRVRIQ